MKDSHNSAHPILPSALHCANLHSITDSTLTTNPPIMFKTFHHTVLLTSIGWELYTKEWTDWNRISMKLEGMSNNLENFHFQPELTRAILSQFFVCFWSFNWSLVLIWYKYVYKPRSALLFVFVCLWHRCENIPSHKCKSTMALISQGGVYKITVKHNLWPVFSYLFY